MAFDVVTLGETMLRLAPPMHLRLEQATTLDVELAGSESNMAVGLARLGLQVAWVSRLPDNALGRIVSGRLAAHGVDVSQVINGGSDRQGLYFLELASPPRGMSIIYDRRDSAMSRIQPSDLPLDLFQPGTARLLHLSGITPAISPSAAATCRRALALAKEAGWQVSFDLNYRSKLWSAGEAREGCQPFLAEADLILAPWRDAVLVLGLDQAAGPEAGLAELASRYPDALLVLTLGGEGALGRSLTGEVIHQPAFPTMETVGRIGAGDAFAAGVLYGVLTRDDMAAALRWGTAMAALKHTIPGDLALVDREEVEMLLHSGGQSGVSR